MPWHIESDNPDCSGFAVVKDSDSSVAGCHKTKADAEAQLAALYASEEGRTLAMTIPQLRALTDGAAHRVVCSPHGAGIDVEARSHLTANLGSGPALRMEVREKGDAFQLSGHAAVFNRLSEDLGGFREVLAPGAFAGVLDHDVRLLVNHEPHLVLARTRSGTLRITEDAEGLAIDADPALTSYGQDLRMLMLRGDIDAMSFGFSVAEDDWEINDAGMVTRTVISVRRLWDVSVVAFPAYPQTDVQARKTVDTDVGDADASVLGQDTGSSKERDPRRFAAWWRAEMHNLTEGART